MLWEKLIKILQVKMNEKFLASDNKYYKITTNGLFDYQNNAYNNDKLIDFFNEKLKSIYSYKNIIIELFNKSNDNNETGYITFAKNFKIKNIYYTGWIIMINKDIYNNNNFIYCTFDLVNEQYLKFKTTSPIKSLKYERI